jgi:hypothetical protein
MKRLCRNTVSILHSASDGIHRFLAIGHFDTATGQFIDWFEKDPFGEEFYWK